MTNALKNSLRKTADGFIHHSDGTNEDGLTTTAAVLPQNLTINDEYDVIIIGAGFTGLIAARELSLRGRSVLIIEARDRIGGRTFTAHFDNHNYEIGGTWIHWSQPHVWTEMTRYGLSLTESKGATADNMTALPDNGTKLKEGPMTDLFLAPAKAMEKFSNVDGAQGRTVFPLLYTPFAAEGVVKMYDQLSLKDRLDQILNTFDSNEETYQILSAILSMNMQNDLVEGGFIDHLRWWILGDCDTTQMAEKVGRYKIKEDTSALAWAILNDCHQVKLFLSTPILSINHTSNNSVVIHTQKGQVLKGRTVIVIVLLNALKNIEFNPPLALNKQKAIAEGPCSGGTKFWAKLEKPVGSWFGFAPYPNPITYACADDDEGSIIFGFRPDGKLDIQNIDIVKKELRKLLPNIKVKYVFGHDWRNDPFVLGTWGWYKTVQMSSIHTALQTPEPPVFFDSSDIANGWRGFIDGALESGLTSVRQVQEYLKKTVV